MLQQRSFVSATSSAADGKVEQHRDSKQDKQGESNEPKDRRNPTDGSPISWKSVLILSVFGFSIYTGYKLFLDQQVSAVKHVNQSGKPVIGGPFSSLIDKDGQQKSSSDFHGQFLLLYFGFTKCPDICPTEMKKMMSALEQYGRNSGLPPVRPMFISIDPSRDTPQTMKEYAKDFPDNMVWLTGDLEQIDTVAKAYRLYYSIPSEDEKQGDDDYLVDHSIFFYLVDDKGEFMEYFGKNYTAEEVAQKMTVAMTDRQKQTQ